MVSDKQTHTQTEPHILEMDCSNGVYKPWHTEIFIFPWLTGAISHAKDG